MSPLGTEDLYGFLDGSKLFFPNVYHSLQALNCFQFCKSPEKLSCNSSNNSATSRGNVHLGFIKTQAVVIWCKCPIFVAICMLHYGPPEKIQKHPLKMQRYFDHRESWRKKWQVNKGRLGRLVVSCEVTWGFIMLQQFSKMISCLRLWLVLVVVLYEEVNVHRPWVPWVTNLNETEHRWTPSHAPQRWVWDIIRKLWQHHQAHYDPFFL